MLFRSHKYDPIPQRDYYRLSAVLQGAYDPYEWKPPNKREFDLALASEREEAEKHNAPLRAEQDKLKDQIRVALEPFRQKLLDEKLEALPEAVRADLKGVLAVKPADRSEVQKYLADKFKSTLELKDNDVTKRFPEANRAMQPIERELQAVRGKMKPKPHVRVLMDNEHPSQAYLLRRGDPVSVEFYAPGFAVTANGIAETEARIGERVRVRVDQKANPVMGEAVDAGTVRVGGLN